MSRSVSLPASDSGFFSFGSSYNASDVTVSASMGNWNDGVGRAMLNAARDVTQEYNRIKNEMWTNIERLSKITVDVEPYESCYSTIEELRRAAVGG